MPSRVDLADDGAHLGRADVEADDDLGASIRLFMRVLIRLARLPQARPSPDTVLDGVGQVSCALIASSRRPARGGRRCRGRSTSALAPRRVELGEDARRLLELAAERRLPRGERDGVACRRPSVSAPSVVEVHLLERAALARAAACS